MNRRAFLTMLPAPALARQPVPLFSFGILADIQYADKDTVGRREYRAAFYRLRRSVELLNAEPLRFVVQLGDLVDGGLDNLRRILPEFNRVKGARYHVLGNHDLDIPRKALLPALGLKRGYYDFTVGGWQFLVLDGLDLSTKDPQGRDMLEKLRQAKAVNAQEWNGGIGDAQKAWLRTTLAEARRRRRRAVIFCHFPLVPESCRPEHLLWNYEEILEIIDAEPSAAAWFNGHDHNGGHAIRNRVHYFTLPGLVESKPEESTVIIDVHPTHLIFRNPGRAISMRIDLH